MEGLARERESLAAWRALPERGRVLLHGGPCQREGESCCMEGLARERESLAAWRALPERGRV